MKPDTRSIRLVALDDPGRGGKAKEEDLKATALAHYVGKRARKGHKVDGLVKALRVV